MPPKRRIHLGIDYGTSTSKIVFRDYGAPGGEVAFIVVRNGSFRIPSRVCVTPAEFVFGGGRTSSDKCDIYESVKMRVAADVSHNPGFYLGPSQELPNGFTSTDLAVLTMWFLISEGHRSIADYLEVRNDGVGVGMTMGIPIAFYNDAKLKSSFLGVARRSWTLYRNEGRLESSLSVERARFLLDKHFNSVEMPIPEYEIRDWLRSEAEAAMWWPFQSPAIQDGPYVKVDIGAGTTHASHFRISRHFRPISPRIGFFGADSQPFGMDAVDRKLAETQEIGADFLALRGREESILRSDRRAHDALFCSQGESVVDDIYKAHKRSWIQTSRKIANNDAEKEAWRDHMVFVIGGGSFVSKLVENIAIHPGRNLPLRRAPLEQPNDLSFPNGRSIPHSDLPFVMVAYGLSNIGLSIPEVFMPGEMPPMPSMAERRSRLDIDDIYAK